MSPSDCRNELVAASRRGRLTSAERTTLAAHLASCEACRTALALGRAFDAAGALEAEDGLRIAKLGIIARRWAESGRGAPGPPSAAVPRRAARTWLFAACLCLVALGASAGARLWMQGSDPAAVPSAPPRPAAVSPLPARQRVSQAIEATAPALVAAPVPSATTTPPLASATPMQRDSAETLFQRASRARRSGEAKLATALYLKLQREYPGSAEARLSHLRLGSLSLERGDAAMALRQFDRHLATGNSALAPEALYGRGRALAVLGRVAEERQAWEQLMTRFPTSPYVAHARRRLGPAKSALAGKDTP